VVGGDLDNPLPPLGAGLVSVSMMSSLSVVARTAPASEDGVQLGGVKRSRVLPVRIAREPAETPGAIEEPGPRQIATRLADGERGDERAAAAASSSIRRSRASVTRWMEDELRITIRKPKTKM
jgi:hypothetical protein